MEQQNSFTEKEEPIFSREKSLLTVEQYAAGQKVSSAIVSQCAKLGVVQVRKHKNKTFIVDLPLNTYRMLKNKERQNTEEQIDSAESANITEIKEKLSKTIVKNPEKPTNKQSKSIPNTSQWPTGLGVVPDLKLFAKDELTSPTIQLGTIKRDKKAVEKFRVPFIRGLAEKVKSIPSQKLYLIGLSATLAILLLAYTMVSLDKNAQQKKLNQAYENINNLSHEYENTKQAAKLHEFDMLNWRSQAERSKRAVRNYETELAETRRKLYETKKDLVEMRQFNTETLQQLTEKLSNINEQLPAN